jgi:orotate phosphoribosyltransferase
LATAVVLAAYDRGAVLEGFFVRKQAKDHGSQKRVEGRVEAGQRVLIIDDVLTTGTSAEQAVLAAEQAGLVVAGVACIVDRQQGAREKFEGRYPFSSLFTSADLGLVADPS